MQLPLKINNMWIVNTFWFSSGGAVLCYDNREGFKGYIMGLPYDERSFAEIEAYRIARWGSKLPWGVLAAMFMPLSNDLETYETHVRQLIKVKENSNELSN